jgi:hypothetical protein
MRRSLDALAIFTTRRGENRMVNSVAMVAAFPAPNFEEDQHVVLRAMSWQDFEALLAIRGERSGVRMYYLDGEIEIVSSTQDPRGTQDDARPAARDLGTGVRHCAERLRIMDAQERAP